MRVIKHKLDDILVISLVFDNQDDIESVRAWCGGSHAEYAIRNSSTSLAPVGPAKKLIPAMTAILNPLSKLWKKK